tara:strand:+ start:638 stop:1027 length:390 start_codon:yes stop_codon:yes gene_type:complete
MTSILNWRRALSLAIIAGSFLATPVVAADGDNIGDTQMCINSNHIKDTPVIDSKTILVKMDLPQDGYKRIDLLRECAGLNNGSGFAYDTPLNKLCKQDTLIALGSGGSRCLIDKIVTIDKAEARALMER